MTAAVTPETRLSVEELHDLEDLRAACELFLLIWGRSGGDPPVVPELLRAVSHAGGYVAGARERGRLVGASMAFLGRDGDDLILHSHITGVHPDAQSQGVGALLKRHQQQWAAARGIRAITWTFDPLVRRNGRFNLTTLGANAVAYLPDFYGVMADALNGGDPTDRCVARWGVNATGRADLDVEALRNRGAELALVEQRGGPKALTTTAGIRLIWTPPDIVALRASDPAASLAWRLASREAFSRAFDDGLVGVGVTKDGWYVFASEEEAL